MMTRIVFLICLFLSVLSAQAVQAAQTIRAIEIKGAQRVEEATIRSYMGIEKGQSVDRHGLDETLKKLFATGLFADVSLSQDGDVLLVDVVENPVINQIAFEGNDKVGTDELMAEISLRPRQVFTRTKVQSDVTRLYQVYRRSGRFAVNIDPKVIKLDQNRVDLVFEIEEGVETTVGSIRFVGNTNFDDSALRSEISTQESRWYRFMNTDDRYDPDRLAYDQELLRRFYLKNGYADFQVISAVAELSNDRSQFFLTFTVDEGERYKLGEVKINSHLRDFDPTALEEQIKTVKSGDWYDANLVQEAVGKITDALGDMQFAFVNVRPEINRHREENVIDIIFQINETPRVFVERVDIKGNVRTLDKVIRRALLLVEGDPFNRSKLVRSENRVRDLNFFETATVNARPGSAPDKTIIEVNVTEKSTGELSIGAGFSTSDGPLADLRVRERNLMGKGQDLLLATTLAGERTEFDVSFTEPYFLSRDLSAGFDLFHRTTDLQDESSYDQKQTGGGLRVGYPLSERWRQTLRYNYKRNEITGVDSNASLFIQEQEGIRHTSSIAQRLTYDNRDSSLFPTSGLLYWLDAELAGLGGDAKYYSGRTGANYYIPVARNWTFNVLGETGGIQSYGSTDVQINERFFLGGTNLRGFERAGVGPRDVTTEDSLGGNFFYRTSAELAFPLGLPEEMGVRGHAFTDAGSLWDIDDSSSSAAVDDESSLRMSAGVGFSWRSPMGPLRMDFSVPIMDENYDKTEAFQFNFGTRF